MGGVGSLVLTQRDLELHELEALAGRLASAPELWREHVKHERESRFYVQLHRDPTRTSTSG